MKPNDKKHLKMSTRSSSIHEDGLYTNLSEVHSLHRHSHHPSSYPYDDDTNNYLVVSDNQTDISSDLIATTKYLEKQFQQRYNILKIAYEDRIKQLSSTLEETCHEIVSNEIIDSLKQDPTSSMFIPNFIQDILFSHLKSERENYILEILNHEAELKYLLQTEKDLCHQQNETILSLKQEIQQNKEADEVISSMKEQIKTLKERYQQLFEQNKEELTTAVKLKEAAELKETSLREQLRFISDNLQV